MGLSDIRIMTVQVEENFERGHSMNIRKLCAADTDLLVRLRMDYLREQSSGFDDSGNFVDALGTYFERAFRNGQFVAVIAEDSDEICATALLSISERPPRAENTSNLVGTVYNVYTYPKYRRQGIGTRVMTALLNEAKNLGVATVELSASGDGRPLYDQLGFQIPKYTYMKIKL